MSNKELLKKQLLEAAREMGIDVEWYQQEIISDDNCLNGLVPVEE